MKQFWSFEEISIYINGGLGRRIQFWKETS